MCGSSSRTFSLPVAYHFPQYRRENVRLEEPHILFTLSRTISHTAERIVRFFEPYSKLPMGPGLLHRHKERGVLRASHSLCLSHIVSYETD